MYKLTEVGRKKCQNYIREMKSKRKEIMDARKDTCCETEINYTPESLLADMLSFGIDDDGEIWNTDHYDMDYPLHLELEIDFKNMSWAENKVKELEVKGKENWDTDDYEAWCYCQECFAEDEAEKQYLDNYMEVY